MRNRIIEGISFVCIDIEAVTTGGRKNLHNNTTHTCTRGHDNDKKILVVTALTVAFLVLAHLLITHIQITAHNITLSPPPKTLSPPSSLPALR